jgi:membrane-bound serine protease (ClpP class)
MMTFRPIRFALTCLAGSLLTLGVARAIEEGTSPQASPPPKVPAGMVEIVRENRDPADGPAKVVVIPVQDQIAKPVLFVIRRGLKEAIRDEADLVVLDMKTPGGSLGVTFEIMEAL